MKTKPGFLLRSVSGINIVAPVGMSSLNFNGVIKLNDSGAFLWEKLEKGATEDEMTAALLNHYDDVDEPTARDSVRDFVKVLRDAEILDD